MALNYIELVLNLYFQIMEHLSKKVMNAEACFAYLYLVCNITVNNVINSNESNIWQS